MVLRTAKRGESIGTEFLGCQAFPRCKGTRDAGGGPTANERVDAALLDLDRVTDPVLVDAVIARIDPTLEIALSLTQRLVVWSPAAVNRVLAERSSLGVVLAERADLAPEAAYELLRWSILVLGSAELDSDLWSGRVNDAVDLVEALSLHGRINSTLPILDALLELIAQLQRDEFEYFSSLKWRVAEIVAGLPFATEAALECVAPWTSSARVIGHPSATEKVFRIVAESPLVRADVDAALINTPRCLEQPEVRRALVTRVRWIQDAELLETLASSLTPAEHSDAAFYLRKSPELLAVLNRSGVHRDFDS